MATKGLLNPVTLEASSAVVGTVGIDQTTPGTTNAVSIAQLGSTTVATGNGVSTGGALRVAIVSDQTAFSVAQSTSSAAGGITSTARLLTAAASTNGTNVKASIGRLYSIQGWNAATSLRYLKLYNKATAPTVGTDTPVKTIALPPSAGFVFDWPPGYSFALGIGFGLTTGVADADVGAVTAGDILGLNLDYT